MRHSACITIVALWTVTATAQTVIFDQNFDGGYTGSISLGHYSGGVTGTNQTLTSGGNPNGCWQETMTPTNSSGYYGGQLQFTAVSGNTDTNPNNYTLSFDAKGSQAAIIDLGIQTWQNSNFGGSGPVINASVNDQLASANTWQTFSVNLGTIITTNANGATWQLNFQMNAGQWGGVGPVDTLTIDNVILTHLSNSPQITSSANPAAYNQSVTFTATVVTNGVAAGNATGAATFSFDGFVFTTNELNSGRATSSALTNLPVGSDVITAVYFGGNYPASTNTFTQMVNPPSGPGVATANLPIYTDNLVNGFQNWSWATVNFQNFSPVHSGSYSIAVNDAGDQGLVFMRSQFNDSAYTSLSFWVNGGSTGGQSFQVWGELDDTNEMAYPVTSLPANTWEQITVPLYVLGIAGKPNVTGISIQGTAGKSQPTFYVDDVELTPALTPTVVHLGANAGQMLQPVDARQFGLNTATWDGSLGNSQTLPLLQQIGTTAFRWPGGSTSDGYNWATDPSGNSTFQNLATNLGAQVFTTINYGSGTFAEATSWVLYANKTNNCNFKYWEVGNECYGSWEEDNHAIPHDPYTYATNAAAYIQQMKAAYPSVPIKVGVVVVPGEDSYANNEDHSALNPVTGVSHYGWTPVVLSTLKSLGVTPDFLIYHFYWQYTTSGLGYYAGSADSDPLLLQVAGNPSPLNWSDWASAAASLRSQLTDYMGPTSSNVELCVTENNSDAGAMGRQSTSIINALYLADSTCQLMETEFRSYIWWDLHNGSETDGDFDPTIYGWRTDGDYGILSGSNTPYPTFYAEKLLESFARPGDSVLVSSSDNLLLSAYAVRRTNGALTMLVVNKDMVANLVGQIALTNFVPWSTATVRSYGIPQDQAAENNGSALSQDVATNTDSSAAANFSYTFPPLSLTLFTFAPGPAALSVQQIQAAQVQLLLQGQSGAPYIIQSSPDLNHWTSISTNTLTGNSTNVSLSISPGHPTQFFRAVWQQ
ncbi:MAG TPA: hypothetical protein VNU95_16365 [Candidatus Acidoferrales bacterium]|nr:hypothetical protein [Candidatus Acidoferrales bacterium]